MHCICKAKLNWEQGRLPREQRVVGLLMEDYLIFMEEEHACLQWIGVK
jgi:hypothetical protein